MISAASFNAANSAEPSTSLTRGRGGHHAARVGRQPLRPQRAHEAGVVPSVVNMKQLVVEQRLEGVRRRDRICAREKVGAHEDGGATADGPRRAVEIEQRGDESCRAETTADGGRCPRERQPALRATIDERAASAPAAVTFGQYSSIVVFPTTLGSWRVKRPNSVFNFSPDAPSAAAENSQKAGKQSTTRISFVGARPGARGATDRAASESTLRRRGFVTEAPGGSTTRRCSSPFPRTSCPHEFTFRRPASVRHCRAEAHHAQAAADSGR